MQLQAMCGLAGPGCVAASRVPAVRPSCHMNQQADRVGDAMQSVEPRSHGAASTDRCSPGTVVVASTAKADGLDGLAVQ